MQESPVKKHLHAGIQPSTTQYEYQDKLCTLGMRIRQAVDQGYQLREQEPQCCGTAGQANARAIGSARGSATASGAAAPAAAGSRGSNQNADFSNICMQDNTRFTIPEYKRVPMYKQPPMLVNQRTVSSNSTLEQWEQNLDQRLSSIDNDIMRNKLGASDFLLGSKRSFDDLDF